MFAYARLRGRPPSATELLDTLARGGAGLDAIVHQFCPVAEDVSECGSRATLTRRGEFDGMRTQSARTPEAELDCAPAGFDAQGRDALTYAENLPAHGEVVRLCFEALK